MKTSRILALCLSALLALAVVAPGPAGAAPAPLGRDGTLITFHGAARSATLPLSPAELQGAPRSFRAFAREQLRQTWVGFLHHRPACQSAPLLNLRALRTDGFAIGDFGTHPVPGCQTGGGYVAFWAIRQGKWKQVIGTQDVPTCARLEKLDFPSAVGVHECYDGTDVVPYTHD